MITDITSSIELSNGSFLPMLGFGTWKLAEGEEVRQAVDAALKVGYRHIDTAAAYENEKGVGEAIQRSGVDRDEIFLTTKVWNDDIRQGFDAVMTACERSLSLLDTDYLDLYLLHWPTNGDSDLSAWKAMERLLQEGTVNAIGVCNYHPHHLDPLIEEAHVAPMVNQVEFHPFLTQPDLQTYCRRRSIVLEAWSPLMQGHIGEVPEIVELAKAYGKSPAQIVLRWDLQKGIPTIPKSARPNRIAENAQVFDFELSKEEMQTIDALDAGKRFGPDPDDIDF